MILWAVHAIDWQLVNCVNRLAMSKPTTSAGVSPSTTTQAITRAQRTPAPSALSASLPPRTFSHHAYVKHVQHGDVLHPSYSVRRGRLTAQLTCRTGTSYTPVKHAPQIFLPHLSVIHYPLLPIKQKKAPRRRLFCFISGDRVACRALGSHRNFALRDMLQSDALRQVQHQR